MVVLLLKGCYRVRLAISLHEDRRGYFRVPESRRLLHFPSHPPYHKTDSMPSDER